MNAKEQINAIANLTHVLRQLSVATLRDRDYDEPSSHEDRELIAAAHDAANHILRKIEHHFDKAGMTEAEWDATASLEDYNQEEQEIIAKVKEQS